MNQQQIKHAKQRIEKIFSGKQKEVKEAYWSNGVRLKTTEILTLYKQGKIKPKSDCDSYFNTSLKTIFDVSSFESSGGVTQKGKVKLQELESLYNSVLDELILGDNEQALALIQKLDNFKV